MKALNHIFPTIILLLCSLFAFNEQLSAQCSAGAPAGAALFVGPGSEYAYRYQGPAAVTNLGIVFCAEDQEYQFKRLSGENEFAINPIANQSTFSGDLIIGEGLHSIGQAYFGPNKRTVPGFDFIFEGNVLAERITLEYESNWPDFVFQSNYSLRTLPQLENYIQTNGHLPYFPAASKVESEGMDVAEVQAALLQTIEEYSLYLIEADKQLREANERLAALEAELNEVKAKLSE